jgi:hypothetical protein
MKARRRGECGGSQRAPFSSQANSPPGPLSWQAGLYPRFPLLDTGGMVALSVRLNDEASPGAASSLLSESKPGEPGLVCRTFPNQAGLQPAYFHSARDLSPGWSRNRPAASVWSHPLFLASNLQSKSSVSSAPKPGTSSAWQERGKPEACLFSPSLSKRRGRGMSLCAADSLAPHTRGRASPVLSVNGKLQ